MENVIKVTNLCKKFKDKTVLKDVSFTVKKGDIYGLIGRNGAGKTTIMKILLGLIPKTGGEISVFENDCKKLLKVGSIIETPTFYDKYSVYNNMVYHAKLLGISDYDKIIDEKLELVGMQNEKDTAAKKLSLGMRQKVAIAMTLLNEPELLILDEPINGLDPVAIAEVRNILKKVNSENGTTIFISSHILGEMQKLATKYGFIRDGMLVGEITEKEVEEKNLDLEKLSLKMMGVADYE